MKTLKSIILSILPKRDFMTYSEMIQKFESDMLRLNINSKLAINRAEKVIESNKLLLN
jgi:hypothetical protein